MLQNIIRTSVLYLGVSNVIVINFVFGVIVNFDIIIIISTAVMLLVVFYY